MLWLKKSPFHCAESGNSGLSPVLKSYEPEVVAEQVMKNLLPLWQEICVSILEEGSSDSILL